MRTFHSSRKAEAAEPQSPQSPSPARELRGGFGRAEPGAVLTCTATTRPRKASGAETCKKPCNCIALALAALKTQPPVMLSVLENPKTTEHEEQRSRRDEFKELLSLTDSRGWGSRGGAQSSVWEGFQAPHTIPAQSRPRGFGNVPSRGPPGSVIPRKSKLHPLWGSRETCCLQNLLNSSGLIILLVHFWGGEKKIWLIKL